MEGVAVEELTAGTRLVIGDAVVVVEAAPAHSGTAPGPGGLSEGPGGPLVPARVVTAGAVGRGDPVRVDAVVVPADEVLDLHSFTPRDVPVAVAAFLEAAAAAGHAEVRLVHGRGRGVQRAVVQRLLAGSPEVVSFADAPPERGGWGATLARLRPRVAPAGSPDASPRSGPGRDPMRHALAGGTILLALGLAALDLALGALWIAMVAGVALLRRRHRAWPPLALAALLGVGVAMGWGGLAPAPHGSYADDLLTRLTSPGPSASPARPTDAVEALRARLATVRREDLDPEPADLTWRAGLARAACRCRSGACRSPARRLGRPGDPGVCPAGGRSRSQPPPRAQGARAAPAVACGAMGSFFITTPIYYVNAEPHVGPRVHDDHGRRRSPATTASAATTSSSSPAPTSTATGSPARRPRPGTRRASTPTCNVGPVPARWCERLNAD